MTSGFNADVGKITQFLREWKAGRREAADDLFAESFEELRRIARRQMKNERPGTVLQPTALLNEACLKLIPKGPLSAETRTQFLRLMASEMKRRLIDQIRKDHADKRGGRAQHVDLDSSRDLPAPSDDDGESHLLDRLDKAVERLSLEHERVAHVVQCRYLLDMTVDATAKELNMSPGTVKRDWIFGKVWLRKELNDLI
jgi:RNA polymerase sigma factor (TIGR02999 family)